MTTVKAEYQPLTAANALRGVSTGLDPWLCFGQFLDDWRREPIDRRSALVIEPLPTVSGEAVRWAALLAGAVDLLCVKDGLPVPLWTNRGEYRLAQPWFLYPGWRLRAWQLFETPVALRARNIFAGDRLLERV